jgi:hypothetical protein
MEIWQIVIGVLSVLLTGTFGVTYQTTQLEDYCNSTITVPCPNPLSSIYRGGTLQFYIVPRVNCSVRVTLNSPCNNPNNSFAIYINIRESVIGQNDTIEIYENSNGTAYARLLKKLSGGTTYASTNPSSVGQFRTDYTATPALTFNYIPGSAFSNSYQAFFDYNILLSPLNLNTTVHEKYCMALGGYVHEDLMCDTSDRVNCPSYFANLPVHSVDNSGCLTSTTRTTTRPTTQLYTTGGSVYTVTLPNTLNLENYCGSTITLPCPSSSYYNNRYGTFRFYYVPTTTCIVKVTLSSSCDRSSDRFAIYANIKESKIGPLDLIEIYENSTGTTSGRLLKNLNGGTTSALTNPTSAGQFMTQFTARPTVTFKYNPRSVYLSSYQAYFDFNILQSSSNNYLSYDRYCSSLSGYVHKDLMCDSSDRVNCPSSYSSSSPVYDVDQSSCTSTSSIYLSSSAISGIVAGCIAALCLIGGLIGLCVRAHRRRQPGFMTQYNPSLAPTTIGGTTQSQPTMTELGQRGGPAPYPVQPVGVLAPPPAYSAVAYTAPYPAAQAQITFTHQSNQPPTSMYPPEPPKF